MDRVEKQKFIDKGRSPNPHLMVPYFLTGKGWKLILYKNNRPRLRLSHLFSCHLLIYFPLTDVVAKL